MFERELLKLKLAFCYLPLQVWNIDEGGPSIFTYVFFTLRTHTHRKPHCPRDDCQEELVPEDGQNVRPSTAAIMADLVPGSCHCHDMHDVCKLQRFKSYCLVLWQISQSQWYFSLVHSLIPRPPSTWMWVVTSAFSYRVQRSHSYRFKGHTCTNAFVWRERCTCMLREGGGDLCTKLSRGKYET